jgi:hypothetical protein
MVWIIGLFTLSALIWVLAVMMAAESDSERRRRVGYPAWTDEREGDATGRRAA